MRQQILPANVEDERDLRLQRDDVREILVGADAQIRSAGTRRTEQRWDDPLKSRLVRDEIVGLERSTRFGKIGDELPERAVTELRGNIRRRNRRRTRGLRRDDRTDEQKRC